MLNRRHLRIKILQALYAFFSSQNDNVAKGEKELFHSIDKIYDLYVYLLLMFEEVRLFAANKIEDDKKKRLPTEEDLNPNLKFINNQIFHLLANNAPLQRELQQRKIAWGVEQEFVKKIFNIIRASEEYEAYMSNRENNFEEDRELAIRIFKKYIANFDLIHHYFEEKSIYWMDDLDLVCTMVIKTIKSFDENSTTSSPLMALYKDEADEKEFIKGVFRKTILNNDEHEKMIEDKTKNWELERIAMMDVLLMKMAITEARVFSTIPIKVTLNEYIEISKFYSTPKSNVFINGILDKIFAELKDEGKIKKIGRGLIE